MKKIIVLLAAMCMVTAAFAQEKGAHSFEVGVGANTFRILSKDAGSFFKYDKWGEDIYGEYRYGISDHFDIGGQLQYRRSTGIAPLRRFDCSADSMKYLQVGLMAVADYNILPSKLINPFVGACAGGGRALEMTNNVKVSGRSCYGVLAPRIGVQIWHFRLTWEYDFAYYTDDAFLRHKNAHNLNLGFTF